MHNFHKIQHYIHQHQLLTDNCTVIVGISGGADSVFLLLCLSKLGYNCIAVHCNFHLRGEESIRDEQFVRNLCAKINIKLIVKDFDTISYATLNKKSIELAARELRYNYFEQTRQEYNAQSIAVAHHRDDNVETFLWNMVRGTGLRGLRGMLPKNGNIIRPLLCIGREDIIDYLASINQDFVTDSSNLKDDVTRNKIRLNLLPMLRQLNNGADNNISTMMENMQEVWNIYTQFIQQSQQKAIITDDTDNFIIDLSRLDNSNPSPITLLYETLYPLGFTRPQIEDMLTCKSGATFTSATISSRTFSVKVRVSASGKRKIYVT
ncbi:MAG: tRNA lysidine(34) synthetase TilS [Prevotellaceae bacterium]|nr:tRNA lysidine(34) synthetase TilS [Candidatus Colivivens equi]